MFPYRMWTFCSELESEHQGDPSWVWTVPILHTYIHTYINPITKSLLRMILIWAMETLLPTMEGMSFESLYRTFPLLYESGSDL